MAKKIGVGGLIETIVVFELLCSPAYAHANGGLIETIVVFELMKKMVKLLVEL